MAIEKEPVMQAPNGERALITGGASGIGQATVALVVDGGGLAG